MYSFEMATFLNIAPDEVMQKTMIPCERIFNIWKLHISSTPLAKIDAKQMYYENVIS